MHKKLKISIVLAVLIAIFSSFIVGENVIAEITEDSGIHLIVDSLSSKDFLPKEFRKSTDLTAIKVE